MSHDFSYKNKPFKYDYKEKVFFLTSDGVQEGWIKGISYRRDQYESRLEYYVTHKGCQQAFRGYELPEHLLFKSLDELLNYYKKQHRDKSCN